MKTKHTPAPWRVTNGMPYIMAENNTEIAKVNCDVEHEKDIETIQANAKLIAAAPELLEALQDFVRSFENSAPCALDSDEYANAINGFSPQLSNAINAIKKATE